MKEGAARNDMIRNKSWGRLGGYGWPATLELLSPPLEKSVDSRHTIMMSICPACSSIHEIGGRCLFSRQHNKIPANSTTSSVKDFWNHYRDNESMLRDQFNPFMRESIPPLLLDASADSHVNWGVCWFGFVPYPCVTRSWTVVRVHMLDVAPYSVTVRVKDNGIARTFSGQGDQWFTADMDIDFWGDYLLDFTVRAEARDAAGNALDPAWEKKVEGLFAGC